MINKNKIVVVILLMITFFNLNAMHGPELCKNMQEFIKNVKNRSLTEEEAKKEWFRRYPCSYYEESDCYYPYNNNYKQGIKDDNKKRELYSRDSND